jgi:hypothetical protein
LFCGNGVAALDSGPKPTLELNGEAGNNPVHIPAPVHPERSAAQSRDAHPLYRLMMNPLTESSPTVNPSNAL